MLPWSQCRSPEFKFINFNYKFTYKSAFILRTRKRLSRRRRDHSEAEPRWRADPENLTRETDGQQIILANAAAHGYVYLNSTHGVAR